jgi:hypothetical protein
MLVTSFCPKEKNEVVSKKNEFGQKKVESYLQQHSHHHSCTTPADDDDSNAASFVLELPKDHSARRLSACEEVYNDSAYNKRVLFAMCTGHPVPGDITLSAGGEHMGMAYRFAPPSTLPLLFSLHYMLHVVCGNHTKLLGKAGDIFDETSWDDEGIIAHFVCMMRGSLWKTG